MEDRSAAEVAYGVPVAFDRSCPVPIDDAIRFIRGELDDRRIAQCLSAFLMLDNWKEVNCRQLLGEDYRGGEQLVDPLYGLMIPYFSAATLGKSGPLGTSVKPMPPLRADPSWVRQLQAGQVSKAAAGVANRYRINGYQPLPRSQAIGLNASRQAALRILAGLLVPVSELDLRNLRRSLCPDDNDRLSTKQKEKA